MLYLIGVYFQCFRQKFCFPILCVNSVKVHGPRKPVHVIPTTHCVFGVCVKCPRCIHTENTWTNQDGLVEHETIKPVKWLCLAHTPHKSVEGQFTHKLTGRWQQIQCPQCCDLCGIEPTPVRWASPLGQGLCCCHRTFQRWDHSHQILKFQPSKEPQDKSNQHRKIKP